MGVVHRSTTRTTFEQRYQIHRDLSKQLLQKSFKMSAAPVKVKSKYADVNTEPDFDNPKWLARHKHMFDFLDVNKNGKISLDELVFKANTEICEAIKATPEQRKRQQKCVEDFFGGAGLKYGVETHWPEYIEGWKNWLPRSCVNGKMKNQHSSVYGVIACLTSLTRTAVVPSPEMNGFITPNALASSKIRKMRKGHSKFATSTKVTN